MFFKDKALLLLILSSFLLGVNPMETEGGFMYSKIKNPERLFDIELELMDRTELNNLIPSVEKISNDKKGTEEINENAYNETIELSSDKILSSSENDFSLEEIRTEMFNEQIDKYIFGSIRYKDSFSFKVDTCIEFEIYSSNNPNLKSPKIFVRGVSTDKAYFLIPLGGVVMTTANKEAVLEYKIIEARAKY